MGLCRSCGRSGLLVSDAIGFCAACIRTRFDRVWPEIRRVHLRSREAFDLPLEPPQADDGIPCPLCFHGCRIPEGARGYCGLRRNREGKLIGGRPHEGNLAFYHDPLPTNCVADFVCAGGTGRGYPEFAVRNGPEFACFNLAVFYRACSFNCLYCQNFSFKSCTTAPERVSARELAAAADEKTTCICFFGGDPAPQVLHALKASRLAVSRNPDRPLRVCWETNAAVREPFLSRMADLSLRSGGCIKVDLKTWDEGLHRALCGASNPHALNQFASLARLIDRRPEPPFLIASTLLVPGYVDEQEVAGLSSFIAQCDPSIPYRLLAFHPHFALRDLPATSRQHAERCRDAALGAGLRNVSIGNIHLLRDGRDDPSSF